MASKMDELNEQFENIGKKAFEKSQQGLGEDTSNEQFQTPTITHGLVLEVSDDPGNYRPISLLSILSKII